MDLRNKYEMARIEAETKSKSIFERENQDLYLGQIRAKASEHRKTVLESIK